MCLLSLSSPWISKAGLLTWVGSCCCFTESLNQLFVLIFFWQFKIWPSFTFGTLHYFSCWTASIFQVFLSSILMWSAPLQPIPVEVMSLNIIAAFFCCGQQMVTKGQSVLNKRSEEIWWTKKLSPRVWTKFIKYKIICPIPSAKQEI